ncbi:MAG: hypothetical protein Fur0022_13620 [Anaerolineales bacterium]
MTSDYISSALREFVYQRANGQCEYCLIPDSVTFSPHEIDHIIARKHGGGTDRENLALCCSICNKRKGTDLTSIDPENGQIVVIYHPRQDRWSDHFQLHHGEILPLTATGRATVRLLQLNRTERIFERNLLVEAGELKLPG